MEDEDIKLVRRCLEGDRGAFEAIVGRYEKKVYNVALRMSNNREDAEDITQSVFIKVFENLGSYKESYKFFSWLYRIALNESLNFLGQRKRFDSMDEEIASSGKTPEEAYSEVELEEKIQNALMDLSVDYRVIVVLCHFHGFSYREVGFVLDIQEKTVKSRLFTARKLLRDILSKKGFGHD